MAESLLTDVDRVVMKRYFEGIRNWDRARRQLLRNQPNDPVRNARCLDDMMEHALRVHGGPLVDDEKEDVAEVKLARVLSQR